MTTKPPTFAESLFGAMGLPGFAATPAALDPLKGFALPTVDVAELERRIADLRSVESWLQTQATMVRTTIQALEVQRNTVVMVKQFGGSMPGMQAAPREAAADPVAAAAGEAALGNATAWWSMLQDQFTKMTGVGLAAAQGAAAPDKPSPRRAQAATPKPRKSPARTATRRKARDPG